MSSALRRMRYAAWRIRSIRSARSAVPAVVRGVVSDVMTCSSRGFVGSVGGRAGRQLALDRRGAGGGDRAGPGVLPDHPLELGDLGALGPAPGLSGDQGGEQAQQP